jgi:hypothetical protein
VQWEQLEDGNGTVVDALWLVKDAPGKASGRGGLGSPEGAGHGVGEGADQDEAAKERTQMEIFERTHPCAAKEKRLPECAMEHL